MTKQLPRVFLATTTIFVIVCAAAWLSAQAEIPARFTEAQLYFELNNTDGDLGIHGSIDGDVWTDLSIEGPNRLLLELFSRRSLIAQGMTQLFFESAEPPLTTLSIDVLPSFPRALSNHCRVKAGGRIASTVTLSHVMAAPPENVSVNGLPAAASCDAPLPTVIAPVTIDWDAVTQSHPRIGKPGPVKIARLPILRRARRGQAEPRAAGGGHGVRGTCGDYRDGQRIQVRDYCAHHDQQQYGDRKLLQGAIGAAP